MEERQICFISTRGKGFAEDLLFVKNFMMSKYPEISFQYLISCELGLKDEARLSFIRYRNEFLNRAQNVIGSDLSIKTAKKPKTKKRILFLSPYDYIFQFINEKRYTAFTGCTHILVGSRILTKFVKERCKLPYLKEVIEAELPLASDLKNTEKVEECRKDLEQRYPQLIGKKVFGVYTQGKEEVSLNEELLTTDIQQVLANLPEDWCIVTNNSTICRRLDSVMAPYGDKILVLSNVAMSSIIPYISNGFASDDPYYLASFASTGRPVYAFRYRNNFFNGYLKENYEDLFLEFEHIPKVVNNEELTPIQKKFILDFTVDVDKNACEEMARIIFDANK